MYLMNNMILFKNQFKNTYYMWMESRKDKKL